MRILWSNSNWDSKEAIMEISKSFFLEDTEYDKIVRLAEEIMKDEFSVIEEELEGIQQPDKIVVYQVLNNSEFKAVKELESYKSILDFAKAPNTTIYLDSYKNLKIHCSQDDVTYLFRTWKDNISDSIKNNHFSIPTVKKSQLVYATKKIGNIIENNSDI